MKKLFFGFIFILSFVFCVQTYSAQNITQQSYNQAREILDKSVNVYGGVESLRSLQNFSIRAVGITIHRNQSRRTDIAERTPLQISFTADLKNARFNQAAGGEFPGGFFWSSQQVFDGKEMTVADMIRKNKSTLPSAPAGWRNRLRWLPQMQLLTAYERAQRLRYMGKVNFDNRPHEVVSFANEDGLEISLYIDAATSLVSKYEWLGSDVFAGDVVTEVIYPNYQTIGNFKIPVSRIIKTGNQTIEELSYADVLINKSLTDDDFKTSSDLKTTTATPPSVSPVTQLAENVYTINVGGYNVLFVAFKDYVFVMEAPGGDAISRQAIEQIKKTVPGKPIRYIAVTHHHDDHAGGIRTYIAEGATLIAMPGEKSFFEKVAVNKFTIAPDTLALNPQPLKIESIENGKRVFSDGTQTIEIYDIGAGPHTEGMLVTYLPKEKILFQGDLLNRPANGDYPIANDTTVHFAKWLEGKKLLVEKIIPVHGTVTTMAELRTALSEKQRAQR